MGPRPTLISTVPTAAGKGAERGDTPDIETLQAQAVPVRRVRVSALVALRGILIFGEVVMMLVTALVLKWPFPIGACVALIAASVGMNLSLGLSPLAKRDGRPLEVASQLAFDIVQLTALLFLAGGVVNPFAVLLIFPISVAGNALPQRHTAVLCVLSIIAALVLAIEPAAPPWDAAAAGADYGTFRLSRSMALIMAMVFAAAYASWSSARGARRELALNLAESVLAREQRLSALGALSAVIAHELGTPLATITIVASEMMREAPPGPLRDDAALMVEQAKRCREILRRLAEQPERQDTLHERMSLLQFVREIVEPYAEATDVRVEALVTGPPGVTAPDLWRRPEILHAISTMVENAYDFAQGEILLTARFDAETVTVEVRDDGPGFAADILARLGEPYVTSRPGAEGSRSGHVGMGLGVFIAKTLLERSGAEVIFANGPRRGAIVTARWPRSRVEVPASDA
jgi:two-component system sensor histidine kinase RegB